MVLTADGPADDAKMKLASPRKEFVFEDVEDAHISSQTFQQERSEQDNYDSDSCSSDCSVTSGLNGHSRKILAFSTENQFGYSTADESGDTTWTDEKHSSYLDSMEATFVQKMYDKEYCSVDVCGHSSTSSLTVDHDCVESQPFWLNMRKPFERKVTGLLTFQAPTRPMAPLPMLTSPWIQHFKSQKQLPSQNRKFQGKCSPPANVKEVPKNPFAIHSYVSFSEHCCESDNGSAYKKRDFAGTKEVTENKKQKCQQLALSHMDIVMEQQFSKDGQWNMGVNKASESKDGQGQATDHVQKSHKCGEPVAPSENVTLSVNNILKEKQKVMITSNIDINQAPITMNRILSGKPDQVVPSYKSMAETSLKTKPVDRDGGEEDALCAAMSEPDCVSNPSGSKTWTWGKSSTRYHVVNHNTSHTFR